ncbi:MAG: FG-GAP repeat protein, partial [Nitrosopumilaceae archaeon]|nr:FG-GAP repeat protein [Nitrosopumilaceae archaeon]
MSNGDAFGIYVANIGDLDGDGIHDIAAGALWDDNGGTNRGSLHIMFMNSNGTIKSTVEINDSTANGPVLSNYDYFGVSVANIGDLDGDGVNDIAAGANEDDNGGTNRGALHIMLMNSNGTV